MWYGTLCRGIADWLTRRDRRIEELRRDIEMVKDCLEQKRVVLFLRMIKYRKGMSLGDDRPRPISLEDLERRISSLESGSEMQRIDLLFTVLECVRDPQTTGFLFKGTAIGIPDWPYMWVSPSAVPVLTKGIKDNVEKEIDSSIKKNHQRRLGNATWEVKIGRIG